MPTGGICKHKIDQGADFVITQLFFSNRDYFEFRDYLTALGVNVPLVPGIIPILSAAQIKRFVALCGAALPEALVSELDRRGDDDEAVAQFGIEYATLQCEELLREGVPGLHFYTLNKAQIDNGDRQQSWPWTEETYEQTDGLFVTSCISIGNGGHGVRHSRRHRRPDDQRVSHHQRADGAGLQPGVLGVHDRDLHQRQPRRRHRHAHHST